MGNAVQISWRMHNKSSEREEVVDFLATNEVYDKRTHQRVRNKVTVRNPALYAVYVRQQHYQRIEYDNERKMKEKYLGRY